MDVDENLEHRDYTNEYVGQRYILRLLQQIGDGPNRISKGSGKF